MWLIPYKNHDYCMIHPVITRQFCIKVNSTPVICMFSQGGIIIATYANMKDFLLEMLTTSTYLAMPVNSYCSHVLCCSCTEQREVVLLLKL